MHPLVMEIIAQQHLRDLQREADRWRAARSVRARRRSPRHGSLVTRIARRAEPAPACGEQTA